MFQSPYGDSWDCYLSDYVSGALAVTHVELSTFQSPYGDSWDCYPSFC